MTVPEALSCGIPVYSTNVGFVKEIDEKVVMRKFPVPTIDSDCDQIAPMIVNAMEHSNIMQWDTVERLTAARTARSIPRRWDAKALHWTNYITGEWDA